MQTISEDEWEDISPSLEKTLELLPEVREWDEAIGNLRAQPNNNLKNSGHLRRPTSRAIKPVRSNLYRPAVRKEAAGQPRRRKPDLTGFYSPRYRGSLPRTPLPDRVPPKKGSYRAQIAEAKKEQQKRDLQTKEQLKKEQQKKEQLKKELQKNDLQRRELLRKKLQRRRLQRKGLLKKELQENEQLENEQQLGFTLTNESDSDRESSESKYKSSTSSPTSQKGILYHTETAPPATSGVTMGNSRPLRKAAIVARQRARVQLDDPFPGVFAPNRVDRPTEEQQSLMPELEEAEPNLRIEDFESPSDYYNFYKDYYW